jgi:beta-lactamase regulating signal transducer with metallopeptidase domain/protocatechuate 3,4-dioxygenase beta subunit
MWIELLESAATICELAGHWFVQSTLLIGVGLLAGRCFANRGAAFTSVIYRTALVAAVLCPLATWLLMQFGLTLGIASLPALRVASIQQVAVYHQADPVSVAQSPPIEPGNPSETWPSTAPDLAGLSRTEDESPDTERRPTTEQAQSFGLSPESSPSPAPGSMLEPTPAAVPPIDTRPAAESADMIVEMVPTLVINPSMATIVASVALVWLFGAFHLLLRLTAAHVALLRLRRAAVPAIAEQQQLCWELAEKMGVWPPAVLTSPFVPGPCLAGVLHSTILLPDELPDVPLATVFVHELAHLRRRDCFWNVARQAVSALLFFQPLVWRLSRRMETTAEEVCDDYVVQHGADRTAYADILVSLAERAWLPASSAVVPLVTFRSLLGRRVARILDGTRRLSLSVSLTALALIVGGGLAATVGTGALGPAGRGTSSESTNAEESIPAPETDAESATAPLNDENADEKSVASGTPPTAVAAVPDANLVLHYRGRVLDPDGKPLAGAAVFFTFDDWGRQLDRTSRRMAATGADGWFDFQTRRSDFEPNVATSWLAPGVVITADGFGCAQAASLAFETTGEARKRMSDVARRRVDEQLVEHDPIVRLVRDDAPLTGRLVSTEGKPLVGARVVARRVYYNTEGILDAWETGVRQPKADADAQYRAVPRGGFPNDMVSILPAAITDRDGRFTLHGVGRERLADIEITGDALEATPLHVRTRNGDAVTLPYRWAATPRALEPRQVYLGNDFLQVIPYAQPVSGRVIDAQTRKPMAQVLVSGGKFDLRPGGIQPRITTQTDDQGRYTLHGLIVGQEEVLHVTPPGGEPYVPIGARVTTALQKPATCDFALRRGVWLRGKVTEKQSGQPLEGVLTYRAFANNLSLSLYPGFIWLSSEHRCHPDEAGNYQLAIPPGPGVISFMATDYKRFRRGAGVETITRPPRMSPGNPPTYAAVPSLFMPEDCTILAQVNPADDAKSVDVNLLPEAGATISVRLVDREGRALSQVECGSTYRDGYWETVDGKGFDVLAYYPTEPRDLFFYDSDRDLAAYHRLEGPAPKELTVVLTPAASVRGRLFDESGAALPHVGLGWFDIPKDRLGQLAISTDDDGRFRIRGLVPGRRYMARAATNVIFGDLVFDSPVAAGEAKDLGDVRLEAVGTTELTKAAEEVNDTTKAADFPEAELVLHYRGRVLDPDGKPVTGAKVFLLSFHDQDNPNDMARPRPVTGDDGWFDFSTRKSDFPLDIGKQWLSPRLTVAANGFGCAAGSSADFETTGEAQKRLSDYDKKLEEFGTEKHGNVLQLARDDAPLTGRLVSTEGKPLADVTVAVQTVWYNAAGDLAPWDAAAKEDRADYYSLRNVVPLFAGVSRLPVVLPATTDAEGRFTLHGIGRERVVDLLIAGPGLETVSIHARTRAGHTVEVPHQWRESERKGSASSRPEIYLANDFLQVIAPAQPVVGRITDVETGAPIADVKVSAGHFGMFLGSGKSYISSTTDAEGRYSLEGLTIGEETKLYITPSKATAYLPAGDDVTTSGTGPTTRDFTLRRGIWVRGRVSEAGTGQPLDGEVAYYAFRDNPHLSDYRGFSRFRGEYGCRPDEQGNFQIAVPPGAGILGFMAREHDRFRRGAGVESVTHAADSQREMMRSYPVVPHGLFSHNKHLVKQIDVAPDAAEVVANLSLVPGATFAGRIVDPAGKPLPGCVMNGQVLSGVWREVEKDSFEVSAYYPDEPRDLYFFHPERNLAAHYHLAGEAPHDLTIQLQPAASVQGRLLNGQGEPATGISFVGEGICSSRFDERDFRGGTDEEGRFHIQGLAPGRKYTVEARENIYDLGRVFADLSLTAGETKDLGDITLVPPDEKSKPVVKVAVGASSANKSKDAAPAAASGTADNADAEPVILNPPPAVEFKKPADVNPKSAPNENSTAAPPIAAVITPEPDLTLRYRGRVVDPDGRPAAGAKIFFHYWVQGAAPRGDLAPLAVTDADGWFDFTTRTSDFDALAENSRYSCGIVATAPGSGFAQGRSIDFETTGEAIKHLSPEVVENVRARRSEQGPSVLQLVRDDVPLVGQVLTIEGKPVAGARVRLHDVMLNSIAKGGGTLDSWEQAAVDSKANFYTLRNQHLPVNINTWQLPSIVPDVKTDAEGRFTVRGIGRERVAKLLIQGPDIEASLVKTRTRAGEILRFGEFSDRTMGGAERSDTVYPHKFTFAAGPSKPVSGRITDADTGAPVAGVTVTAGQTGTFMGFGKVYVSAQTDADGRYRLEGLSIGKREEILAWPPTASGYVPVGAGVTLALDRPASDLDFRLKQGIWLRGQAIDKVTGKPIVGRVQYFSRSKNPQLSSYPGFARARLAYELRSDAQGRFEMPIPPGPGIVTYMAMDHTHYRKGQGAENVAGGSGGEIKTYDTVPMGLFDLNEHVLREINPASTDKSIELTLPIEAGLEVYGKIVDPQGAPLPGGIMSSADYSDFWRTHAIRDNTFHVQGYYHDAPRELFFFNAERNMAGHYHLAGSPPENLVIKLAPAGSIRGRLVDKQGAALARIELTGEGIPSSRHEGPDYMLATDDDGNFLIRGLIPGRRYTVEGRGGEQYGRLLEDVTVEAGPPKDVGDVTLVRPEPKQNATAKTQSELPVTTNPIGVPAIRSASPVDVPEQSATTPEKPIVIVGQVLDPEGRAVAGAEVALQGHRWEWFQSRPDPDRTKTDAQGNFRLEVSKSQFSDGKPKNWAKLARLVARAPGYGMAGMHFSDLQPGIPAKIRLVPDQPIEGRIVDLEGNPVAGAKIDIFSVTTNEQNDLTAWVAALRRGVPFHSSEGNGRPHLELTTGDKKLSDPSSAPWTTDADGRFRITGLGQNRFVNLKLAGGGVVAIDLHVITQPFSTFSMKWDASANVGEVPIHGATFQYIAEPSQPIEGVVRDAKSGDPLPGVRVWSEHLAGAKVSGDFRLQTTADKNGHYRLEGMPRGKGNRICALPQDDQPYFMQEFDVPQADGLAAVQFDLPLHRGVLITGHITAQGTEKAALGGRLFYVPHPDNPHMVDLPEFNSHRLPGPQWRYEADSDGNYRIVGLPGRGYLGLWVMRDEPCPAGQGIDQIKDLPKDEAFYKTTYMFSPRSKSVTAVRELQIGDQDEQATADFVSSSGQRVTLKLVDVQDLPLEGAKIWGLWPRQQHHIEKRAAAQIDVVGLSATEKRRVLLYDESRNLGSAVLVGKQETGEVAITAKLQPCATVNGRLLDKEGEPLASAKVEFQIPGEYDYALGFPSGDTDKDGRFRVTNLPTGCSWDILCRAPNIVGVSIVSGLTPAPGETIDVGEFDITADERPVLIRTTRTGAAPGNAQANADKTEAASPAIVKTSDGASPSDNPVTKSESPAEKQVIAGRVTQPDGQPIAGARVWLMRYTIADISWDNKNITLAETTTDAQGAFRLDHPAEVAPFSDRERFLRTSLVVAATAPGFGLTCKPRSAEAKKDLELTLPPATVKAQGQVLNLEGRPLVGAQLRVIGISDPHDDMPGWIAKAKLNPRESGNTLLMEAKADRRRSSKRAAVYFPEFPMGAIPRELTGPFVTDAQGRVDLGVWGDNRLLQVELSGPGMAKSWVHIITYPMPPIFEPSGDPRYVNASYFGADFRLTVEPEQVIQGTIADAEKGTPIAGAEVRLFQFGDSLLGVHGFVSSTTDAQGKYVLHGVAKPKQPNAQHRLEVLPGPSSPYFRTTFRVPRQDGLAPITHDVSLRHAAWITGRATEKATGKPVRGAVSYYPFLDNEQARNYSNFTPGMTSMGYDDHYPTAEDASFRLPAIVGRGVLLFIAEDQDEYPAADGVDQIAGLKGGKERNLNLYHFASADLANALREVNIMPEDTDVRLNVELPSFAGYPIRFVDSRGSPVAGVMARRLRPPHGRREYNGWGDVKPVGSETILRGFEELESMPVIALARAKGLGAVHEFRKSDFDGDKAYELKLEPCATVKGRLVDKSGKPLRGISVTAKWNPFTGQKTRSWRSWEHNINSLFSDAEGRFSLPELPPGIAYELSTYSNDLGQVEFGKTDILAPGQVVDRGDLTCKPAEDEAVAEADADAKPVKTKLMFRIDSKPAAPAAGEKQDVKIVSSPGTKEATTAVVRGRVVNADGQPIVGADVAVIAMRTVNEPGGFLSALGEIPAEGKTDDAGQFTFTFPKLSTKTHQSAYVIARATGLGLAFAKLNLSDGEFDVTFKVLPEESIRVRIVNVDGQPGVGVPMRIQAITPQDGGGDWQKSIAFTQTKTYPAAWLTAPVPDKEGRFVLHGVPPGYGVSLDVLGDEQFAPQQVSLNTGLPEERTERDATYRPLVKNGKPGEEVVLPLAPAQWFEGIVRAADTNEPIAHAKVSVWASQQQYGSMSRVKGESDDVGHYRISSHPGIRFGFNVIAPDGTPYLNYKTSLDEPIDWQTGEHVRKADIPLSRGILARGTIVDGKSGEPIAGASVQYIPESDNNPNAKQEILTGWQNMRPSDEQGRFNIVVLPGPGRLLVHGPNGSYILREIGSRELYGSKRGGERNYAHAIEKVNPAAGQEPLELRIAIERGERIHGRIVDEQGSSVNEVLVITGLSIRPFWLTWHGDTEPTERDEFELSGMESGVEYPTLFLEPKRRLGAVVKLKSTDTEPTIVLHPCVDAKARFLDTDGAPKAAIRPNFHLVVKPGGFRYNNLAQRMGELAADENFVANIDRVNYNDGPKTDDDGRVVFPALIPGATYRLLGARKGNLTMERDFVVPAGETLDLGDITYDD